MPTRVTGTIDDLAQVSGTANDFAPEAVTLPKRKPGEARISAAEPEPGLWQAFLDAIVPKDFQKSVAYNVAHPAEALDPRKIPGQLWEGLKATAQLPLGIMQAQGVPLQHAIESAQKGDVAGAVAHGINYLTPMAGPMLDPATSMAGRGNVPGAVGHTLGLVTQAALPEAIPAAVRALPALARNVNPAEADAVAWAMAQGKPVDAGTATGSRVVKAVQHMADRSFGGELAGSMEATAREAQGLKELGQSLAERTAPGAGPQTLYSGGKTVRQGLQKTRNAFRTEARVNYGKWEDALADPANQTPLPGAPPPAGDTFAPPAGSLATETPDNLFERILNDARAQGYDGTASALKKELELRYDDAAAIRHELRSEAAPYEPNELFEAIKAYGGIGQDAGNPGEIRWLWENSSGTVVPKGTTKTGRLMRMRSQATGGFNGVTKVLRKTGGKDLDMMAESLRQDPRFQDITNGNDLMDAIAAASGKRRGYQGLGANDLAQVGVRPGTKWWEGVPDETSFDPAAIQASAPSPVATRGPTANIASVKQTLTPIMERWSAWPVLQKQASPAYAAVENLLSGPDEIPLGQAESLLGVLKRQAGSTEGMRDISQGLAAKAVGAFQEAIDTAAGQLAGGPEGLEGLKAGRAATAKQYEVQDLLRGNPRKDIPKLPVPPVQGARQLLRGGDATADQLAAIQQHTPESIPILARAKLEDLLSKATRDGGFAKTDRLWSEWAEMGPRQKAILFGHEPGLVKDLDRFFLLVKRMGERVQPSGTAHVISLGAQVPAMVFAPLHTLGVELGGAAISRLLHSRAGVRLLTEGISVPTRGVRTAAQAAARTKLALMAEAERQDRQAEQ